MMEAGDDLSIRVDDFRECPIRFAGEFSETLAGLWPRDASLAVVIGDRTVAGLHGRALQQAIPLPANGTRFLSFNPGERSKVRRTWARLVDAMAAMGADRDAVVVGFGGGVSTDLAGFVAATYLRGVRSILVPTTLMAQVDAAIGGKTGVDDRGGKNRIGAFHWPLGVVVDPVYLATLPPDEMRQGLAEIVKAGIVGDAELLDMLERHAGGPGRGDIPPGEILRRAIRVKTRIVSRDPFENGERRTLNLGHTVAHAIEAASGLAIRHGDAVGMGLRVEMRIAIRRTGFPAIQAERIEALLDLLGLPAEPPVSFDAARPFLITDKKSRSGRVRLALPRAMGSMHDGGGGWVVDVSEGDVSECWHGRR